jgi:hypothetical protein
MKRDTQLYLQRDFMSARRDLSFDSLVSKANLLFEDLDSPVTLGIYLRLKYKAYAEYLSMEIDPLDYLTPDAFYTDYQCIKLFSKAEFFPKVFDPKKAAELSFIRSEKRCQETNLRFERYQDLFIENPVMASIYYSAARKIDNILGVCPPLLDIALTCGPGQNVGLSKYTSVYDKLNSALTYTVNLQSSLETILGSMPSVSAYHAGIRSVPTPPLYRIKVPVRRVTGSTLGFVPKNAKTHRAICTEPLLNGLLQLGIGRHMRKRLRGAGCNLNNQERNQQLAKRGSQLGYLATVDLASASDTIAYQVVHKLLPPAWFDLLDMSRSPCFTYQGKGFSFEKFSSMGNGYTFELESLIFLALTRATCEYLSVSTSEVSVYGDDIIVPVKAYQLLEQVLCFSGFEINQEKSFAHGPFRESCGKDWFLGSLVRPLFIKRRPTNQTLMGWCNHIFRSTEGLTDHRWARFYEALKNTVPRAYHKLQGPDNVGDGHFVCALKDYKQNRSHSKHKRGYEGVGYYTLSVQPVSRSTCDIATYKAALYGASKYTDYTDDKTASHLSKDGKACWNMRRRSRTSVKRALHPWSGEW